MSEQIDILCLFLTTGRTFTFRKVQIVHDNETAITFRYLAMSDGLVKEATFYKSAIAGVSKCLWLAPQPAVAA